MFERPTLLTSKPSPFGRITRVARLHLGLEDAIAVDLREPSAAKIAAQAASPLGRVPVLILNDTDFVIDSRTILIHFETMTTGRGFGLTGATSLPVLSRLALVTGLLDSALLMLYEARFHLPQHRSEDWMSLQNDKIRATLAYLSKSLMERAGAALDASDIALAVALDYLDFRFEGAWRRDHPRLCAWLNQMHATLPALGKTAIAAEQPQQISAGARA